VSLLAVPITVSGGQIAEYAIYRDVTQRKAVERELTKQRAYLNELFERLPEAIALLDLHDAVVRINPEFTKIFGYSQAEAVGRPLNELVAPGELRSQADEFAKKVTGRCETLNVETVRARKDGSCFPISVIAVPISIAGRQVGEYAIYRDISERKLAEQTLRESESYLAEAQRLSHTGSWASNPATGDIRYWSAECYRVLGFDLYEPLPRFDTFLERVHQDDRAAVQEHIKKAAREKTDFELDYRIVHPDTEIRDIHAVGRPLFGRSGELSEFVGTVIDITDRKRAEEELQQLVDFVPQIIVVFGPDSKIFYANRIAREYTGLTLDQYRTVDVVGEVAHPDDAEKMRAVRKMGFSGRDPFELEARLLGKDGVYRWFLCRYNPLIKQGSVARWYATATEIESRKQEEERVRKENVRLEERTRIATARHSSADFLERLHAAQRGRGRSGRRFSRQAAFRSGSPDHEPGDRGRPQYHSGTPLARFSDTGSCAGLFSGPTGIRG
jgi:PAS domain S-box-containing protein